MVMVMMMMMIIVIMIIIMIISSRKGTERGRISVVESLEGSKTTNKKLVFHSNVFYVLNIFKII